MLKENESAIHLSILLYHEQLNIFYSLSTAETAYKFKPLFSVESQFLLLVGHSCQCQDKNLWEIPDWLVMSRLRGGFAQKCLGKFLF
jgi:hypothetical protein